MPDTAEGAADPEDAKLLVVARAAAARTGGAGAAVRDEIGRTYAAGAVGLRSLRLTPVQAAVAAAVSSGAARLAAVALVGADLDADDESLLAELGGPVVVRP